jgi:hypothetical protein
MRVYRCGLALVLLAVLASPALAIEFDVCVNPAADVRLDDIDGNNTFSAGDGFTATGIIVVGGTILQGGVSSCSAVAGARIGTFFARGRIVQGLSTAAADDLAYVDWEFRVDSEGTIDTTGPVKTAATYPQTITPARQASSGPPGGRR